MYNLFITSHRNAWGDGSYEYDRSRFLEYTDTELFKRFSGNYESLKKLPCLFGYEQYYSGFFVGRLNSIRNRDRNIVIEFTIDNEIGRLAPDKIEAAASIFDIRKWEINRTHWAVKNEDLFERLYESGIISEAVRDQGKCKFEDSGAENNSSNDGYVMSLGSFIQKVFEINKADEGDKTIFYRGHSNKADYKLVPSLFRTDKKGNYKYRHSEDLIYREMLISNPVEFQDYKTTLDILIKMQHYSLPTRLLDITSNPLIALYFACKSNQSPEGEVLVFKVKNDNIKYFDSDTVSCLANLARLPFNEQEKIDFKEQNFNDQLPVKRLIHFIKEEKPFFEPKIKPEDLQRVVCVKGKYNNNRITFQSGAFFLFGLNAVLPENGDDTIQIERISVKGKGRLLAELDLLNINESTVFPYIENSAKFIAQKYERNK